MMLLTYSGTPWVMVPAGFLVVLAVIAWDWWATKHGGRR